MMLAAHINNAYNISFKFERTSCNLNVYLSFQYHFTSREIVVISTSDILCKLLLAFETILKLNIRYLGSL